MSPRAQKTGLDRRGRWVKLSGPGGDMAEGRTHVTSEPGTTSSAYTDACFHGGLTNSSPGFVSTCMATPPLRPSASPVGLPSFPGVRASVTAQMSPPIPQGPIKSCSQHLMSSLTLRYSYRTELKRGPRICTFNTHSK